MNSKTDFICCKLIFHHTKTNSQCWLMLATKGMHWSILTFLLPVSTFVIQYATCIQHSKCTQDNMCIQQRKPNKPFLYILDQQEYFKLKYCSSSYSEIYFCWDLSTKVFIWVLGLQTFNSNDIFLNEAYQRLFSGGKVETECHLK